MRILFSVFIITAVCGYAASADDYSLILSRVQAEHAGKTAKPDIVKKYLSDQKSDGSWSDINYKDKSRSTWDPTKHLDRMAQIAGAGFNSGWSGSESTQYKEALNRGASFWLSEKAQSTNWWQNRIGAPQVICKILVLSYNELTDKNRKGFESILEKEGAFQDTMTGTNRTWIAANNFILALVSKKEKLLKSSLAAMTEELRITTDEGLQPDWSFHQHGPMLQTGNYGNSFLSTQTDLGLMLAGTKWEFTQAQKDLLSHYVLDHSQWPVWGKWYDISACGRQMDFPKSLEQKASGIARMASRMALLDTSRSVELDKIKSRVSAGTNTGSPIGTRFFWRSEYLVQRSASWTSSLKMYSSRVMSVETNVNDENKLGAYLNDGALYVRITGDEYDGIQPIMDWRKIPGITGVLSDAPVTPKLKIDHTRASSWVGAAADGDVAAAAMDFSRDDVKVKKAWFFMPWGVAALGFDGGDSSRSYMTTINQSKLRGDIMITRSDEKISAVKDNSSSDVAAVWHDNTAYLIKNGQHVRLSTAERTGRWTDIRTLGVPKDEVKGNLFVLYLTQNGNAGYEYAVVPNIKKEMMKKMKIPYSVVMNSADVQAVEGADDNCAGMVFWNKSSVKVLGLSVEADRPCIVTVVLKKNETSVCAADPSHKLDKLKLRITRRTKAGDEAQARDILFDLPSGGFAGSSVKKSVKW